MVVSPVNGLRLGGAALAATASDKEAANQVDGAEALAHHKGGRCASQNCVNHNFTGEQPISAP
jgi:hypothetical protein